MLRLAALVVALQIVALPAAADSWRPPAPEENGWDWIRMSSGEWFGGEIKLMRDRNLEFDSDELGVLELDITDVTEIRSARVLTYRFDPGGNFTGTAVMRGDTVAVDAGMGVVTFPRRSLVLILEGQERELDFWSARGSVGLVTRSGNTRQTDMNSSLRIRRLTPRTRTLFLYANNYGKVEGIENINNHNLSLTVDILVASGFYVSPLNLNILSDPFQNIEIKTTVSAGVGYVIARDGAVDWDIGLGAGYQETDYVSVEADQERVTGTATTVFRTNMSWDITGNLEMLLDYHVQVGLPEISQAFHHGRATFAFDLLGDRVTLDLGLVWDRTESPRANADGEMPVRDDFRSTVGIGLDL